MSHPHYNPYASGNQRSNQGQYRTSSIQPDRDLRRDIPGYGPGSSFSPPPASSATPANHGGNIPSLLDLPVIHRPEQGRARVSKAIERSVELHVSRAREEVGCLDRPAQPIDQSTRFTHTQSDEILSSSPGTTSYPMSSTSASVGRRHAEGESGSSSLDWLPKYKRSTADDSTKSYSLPASSSYTSSADVGRFKTSSDRERDIPGLGDYVYPAPDKPAAPTETGPHKHTSESAADILLNFGLEKEDLEFLISYPEEQITPDNLPFLLRQIRSHKANRAMTAVESKPFPQPQPSRVVSERDILSSSGGSSAVLQPNKVIEYGHTSKYVGGVLDDIGRTSGRGASSGGSDISLFLNEQRSSSDSREQLETEMRRIPAVLTRVESSSVPPDRSSYTSVLRSAAPVSRDPVQQFQTQPDQTSKPIFNPFSIPKKDAGRKVITSEAWKPSPLKAPETKPQLTLKSQQSSNVLDNVYPGRRGLVVIDKIYSGAAKDESATRGQDPGFSEAPKQQPQMQHLQKQQEQLAQMKHVQKQQEQLAQMKHVQKQQEQLAQMQHVQKQQEQLAQMQHVQKQQEQLAQMQHVQKQQEQLAQMQHVQKQHEQLAQMQHVQKQHEQLAQMQHVQKQQKKQKQPAQKQTAQKQPAQKQSAQKQTAQKQPTQKQPAQTMNAQTQQLQKQPVSQLGLPTVYPTVKPYYFPPNVYPPGSLQPSPNSWSRADQRLVQVPGPQNQPSEAVMFDYAATTPTVFPHTCSLCYKKCFHMKDWISHQNSTLHLNSCKYVRTLYPQWTGEIVPEPSDAGKNATPSTSASGRTSQRRDEKTSAGRRSRSPSPRRRHRPDSSREKRSLSRSSRGSSYGRSRSRSHDRSRSRSYERSRKRERRSSSRRRGDKRSSPRRSKERRSSPRRSRERRSSPRKRSEERRSSTRRRDERRSSPKRRDERRSSVRRSRERRSSSESSSERRSSSADRLVKKVLEKSDVKSLSKPSDVEAVVKTLFAEIAKLKSSSSSSSTKRGKTSKSTPSATRKSSTSAASSSSSASKAKKTTARDEDAKQKTTPQQVVTKDQTVAEGSTKETGAKVSVSEATKVSTQQVSKKSRSEPTNVSEVTVKVETASSSQEPKSPVDNLAETKGRDTKDAKSKLKPQAEGVSAEANQAAGAEPMELGETGGDVAESLEVESCAEGKETNVEAFSDKSSESQSPTSKDETGTPTVQTADEESSQESTERSAASGLGTKMEDSRPPSPIEEGERNTKDPESAEENQRDPTSAAGTGSEKPAAAASFSSALTIGEKVEEHFHPNKIKCLSKGSAMSQECCTTLLISNLPKFHEGCYTEDDVAGVFVPFGLESWSEEIYVVPQARVAFVVMPSALSVRKVLSASPDVFALKENRLLLQVLERKDMQPLNDPFRFYTALMKWMDTPTDGDGHRTVFIRNISPSEAGDLREALRKMGSISNYLPLLNKVFIEFESGLEADRLGIWCSLLKQAPSYTVVRLKAPFSARTAHTPKQPVKAIPHSKDAAAWATTPSQNYGVPRGSCSPFWITMSTSPFVFPTMCPWFAIPKYQTVRGYADIKKLNSRGTMFPTLMLTGFPEGGYRQEDIVRLVRPYYPKHFRHSLYYNVIVLTLQRRAFVHFSDWTSCCEFVKDSLREPFIVRGCVLMVHFLLEDMCPESKEELMFKSMMKWSNSRVPDPESLEERLLCVEISQTSVYLIKTVMKTVASIAKFVSFLPLANRICVEMADSSGAAQVLKKYQVFTPSAQCERLMLKKVIGFRSLKTLEKHIESSSGASTEARPPKQTSISASAEPAGDVPMEDVEKLGAEMATESTLAPKADEDVDAADGDTVPAASSATSLPKSNETTTEHPPIDQDAVTAVLAAVRQHRLALERTQRGETESSLRSQNQDEVTDVVTSDQPLYLSDFVTVDEVGDDVEETNPAHEASRGRGDAKKRKRESPKDVEEADDQIPKDEDQPRKVCSNKHSKATEQKASEILITTKSESDNKKPDATSRRDDGSSKRSGLRTRASKSEEKVKSPEKQDRVVKRSETPRDSTARLPQRDQDPEEEKVSEMLHSTEELVQVAATTERTDRRRSGRGKKEDKMTLNLTEASEKPDEGEEASYEILDSVEDETATEEPVVMTRSTRGRRGRTTQKDQSKKEDTPTRGRRTPARESQETTPKMEKEATSMENSPTKKTDITVREEIDEDATYEILDSVEDEVLQDDRPPAGGKRKRGRRKRAVKSTRKKPVTLKGDKDASEKEAGDEEKVLCQIVDSVEDEMVEDQPPTEESSKNEEEDPVHQIVDSVEDEMVEDQPPTEESLKDKEEDPVHQIVDSVEDEMVEDQPPTEESLKNEEEEPVHQIVDSVEDEMVEDQPPTEESLKDKEEEPVHQIVDSVEDEMVEDQPPTEESLKDKEEEPVHQIVDSVEDEMVEDQPPTEESLKNEEEEPLYQIVDSVENDRVKEELMTPEESKDETCPKEEEAAVQEHAPTCSTIVLEASEKVVAEDLESGNDPSAAEESGVDEKERSLKTDIKEEDTSTTKSQGDAATPAEEKNQQSSGESDTTAVQSALLNLDEVRDEEDDNPEDTAEAEGLRERQAAAKEQERETREEDGRERMSRSAKETGKEQEVVDSTELVTLDEVGADEAGEETVAQGQELDGEIGAGELQGLVTLEEIVDADVEQSTSEPRPPIKEDHAVETLDEAGDDEEGNTDEAEKTTSPVKRRINDDTEESATYVTVDEVEEEGKKEAPRTRGRPKKRTRKKPVRKSTRGKKVVEQAESSSDAPPPTSLDASLSSDKDPSTLSSDSQQEIQKASLEGAGHSSIDAASVGPDLQPEAPENQRLEGEEAIEASSLPSKRKREPVGPEAKRSRSLSPSMSTDIKLPPFSPSNPLGPEFLVPKLGYFCNLCHVFCVHESSARDTHCSSQTHYDNLQKHYEKLQPEPSKGSTGNSQASFSD